MSSGDDKIYQGGCKVFLFDFITLTSEQLGEIRIYGLKHNYDLTLRLLLQSDDKKLKCFHNMITNSFI